MKDWEIAESKRRHNMWDEMKDKEMADITREGLFNWIHEFDEVKPMRMKQDLQEAIDNCPTEIPKFKGRGIVMVAGGINIGLNALMTVRLLRDQGCELPIQMWHLGPSEVNKGLFDIIKRYGVTFVDAYEVRKKYPMKVLNGWECKCYAILHSPYEEVIFIDADNLTYKDPTYLLDSDQFKSNDLYWTDIHDYVPERGYWDVLGCDKFESPEWESGQIVTNKRRSWTALNFCNWLCERGTEKYWKGPGAVHGDKEMFHWAYHLTETPYLLPEKRIATCPGTSRQHDHNGDLQFYHHWMNKMTYDKKPELPEFPHEDKVIKYWEELHEEWNPYHDEMSEADETLWKSMWGQKVHYHRIGHDGDRVMTLGDNGIITEGAGSMEVHWWVKDGKIVFVGQSGKTTCEFEKCKEGWFGRWNEFEKMLVCLEEL